MCMNELQPSLASAFSSSGEIAWGMRVVLLLLLLACSKRDGAKRDLAADALASTPELRIVLAADGGTRAGTQMTSDDAELGRATMEALKPHPDVSVVIDADDQVSFSRVAHAIDVVRMNGAASIFVATPSGSVPMDSFRAATNDAPLKVMVVALLVNGTAVVNGEPVAHDNAISGIVREELRKNASVRVFIDPDTSVAEGRVTRVVEALNRAGIARIGFGNPLPAPLLLPSR